MKCDLWKIVNKSGNFFSFLLNNIWNAQKWLEWIYELWSIWDKCVYEFISSEREECVWNEKKREREREYQEWAILKEFL